MRIAWILPRYGPLVLGGAEAHARAVINQLVVRGYTIEVWTTCLRSLSYLRNELPIGIDRVDGVTVRRFPIDTNFQINLWTDPLTPGNQYLWARMSPHSTQLCDHIVRHAAEFDLLLFMPYSAGTTYHGAQLFPRKSVIWTCLHDEVQAYLQPTRDLLAGVCGLVLNCQAEQDFLEHSLGIRHPNTAIVGMGFEMTPGDAAAFRHAFPNLPQQLVTYAGRWELGKNLHVLIQYYRWYQNRRSNEQLGLLLLGEGPLGQHDYPGVYKLGFVDDATKRNAMAASAVLCQPSLAESLSIVLMEAWVQGVPALVNERCAVLLDHVRRSNGGLYFADYSDFEGALDYLLAHPQHAHQMGQNGQAYVAREYNIPTVIGRMEQVLHRSQQIAGNGLPPPRGSE
jgi:glycosyltransferase involved in cell wall biosynthesis